MEIDVMQDRVRGVLFGLAAGDLNGGPIRMALLMAESLTSCGRLDLGDLSRRYLQWWKEGAIDTGPTFASVLSLVSAGYSFPRASKRVHKECGKLTAGCNPAHRSAPLAMCFGIDDDELPEVAAREAALTHAHPLAGDVAAAAVCLCRALIRGLDWKDALEVAREGRMDATRDAVLTDTLSRDGYAPHVLATAVHFVGRSASFHEALQDSLAFAGPANYCPVLVGSIGGARWGASEVGADLLKHNDELMPRIDAVAGRLAATWEARTMGRSAHVELG